MAMSIILLPRRIQYTLYCIGERHSLYANTTFGLVNCLALSNIHDLDNGFDE